MINVLSNINNDRLDSILNRSVGETSSRLSTIHYYESMIPMMKRISLPLYQLVKKGVFVWGEAKCTSSGNLFYLVSLHLKNHIFKPERVMFNLADTVETSAFCTQWDPTTLNLNMLAAKSTLLTEALRIQSTKKHLEYHVI